MTDDYSRIHEHMTRARDDLCSQVEALEIQNALQKRVCSWREEGENLAEDLQELRIMKPDIYAYIEKLERLNEGVYCDKCKTVKHTGAVTEAPGRSDIKFSCDPFDIDSATYIEGASSSQV